MSALPRRSEIPDEQTWEISALFSSMDEWEAEYRAIEVAIPTFEKYRGTLGNEAALLEWMEHLEHWLQRRQRLASYAGLLSDQDIAHQANSALAARARGLSGRVQAAISFAFPEFLALTPGHVDAMMAEEPRLRAWSQYFDNLSRSRAHVRSAEVEELLAQASDVLGTYGTTYAVLANTDIRFADAHGTDGAHPIGQSNIRELLGSDDRELRASAYDNYADGFLGVRNTMASNMSGKVKATVLAVRARKHGSSLRMSLHENAIPMAVYRNVIDACNRHLPIWHRYWEARRKLLKLDKLEPCDIFAPIAPQVHVAYEQAVQMIVDGMAPLGGAYVSKMKAGLTSERWVDRAVNQGKRQGAYSSAVYGGKSYILMSYSEKSGLQSMSTLAHEVGHSMHSTLSNTHQVYLQARYTLFAAEVASNFNQAMVRAHLLSQNPDRNFQIALIEEAMGNFHRYLFLMPILSQFEEYTHTQVEQGKALTADGMGAYLAGLLRAGYGPAMKMNDAREGITWSQFNHLYANFYVYQYASGIAAANVLADAIAQDPEKAGPYLEFLKLGGSKYPLEALKVAGIDMTSVEPMDRAFGVLEGIVARLEALAT